MTDNHPLMTDADAADYIRNLDQQREAWVRRHLPTRFQAGRSSDARAAYRAGVRRWNARHPNLVAIWRAYAGLDIPPVDPSED